MCWETCYFNISEDGRQYGKPFSCPLVVVKAKLKSALLLWHHHGDTNTAFQVKLANYILTQSTFMIELQITWQWNNISFILNLTQASSLSFDIENSEILCFQCEPTKALQPDSSSGKSWEIWSSADSEPSTFRWNEH